VPPPSTTHWSPLPPRTHEAQFDEKWAFVAKKEARCDPVEARKGDHGDHGALDPELRLVVCVVPGKRTAENAEARVRGFHRWTEGRLMVLTTSDEHVPCRGAILEAYGVSIRRPGPAAGRGASERRTRCRPAG
jgi:hypothetical protein